MNNEQWKKAACFFKIARTQIYDFHSHGLSYNLLPLKLSLPLARLYSDSVYYDRAREFDDPNFGFLESCTKKNALTKLARMSRVRHNAKSVKKQVQFVENFNEIVWNILPTPRKAAILSFIRHLINILFCAIIDDRKSDYHQKCMPKPILARAQSACPSE
jgi:hypothetical protein